MMMNVVVVMAVVMTGSLSRRNEGMGVLLPLKQMRRLIRALQITVLLTIAIAIALLHVVALQVAVAFTLALPFPLVPFSRFERFRGPISVSIKPF